MYVNGAIVQVARLDRARMGRIQGQPLVNPVEEASR